MSFVPKNYVGAVPNKDLDPNLIRRDVRPLRYKIKDFVANYAGIFLAIVAVLAAVIPFTDLPQISDVLFVFGFLFYFYARKRLRTYNFKRPLEPGMDKKASANAGIMFMGNEQVDGSGVWFSADDIKTHMLIFGSTGSGKTRSLLSLTYQALVFGSGILYCDGKADNSVAWLMYSICRRLGRTDDFLVVNYLTGGAAPKSGEVSLDRLSNTTNPFSAGNSEQLRSLIVGLMRGGDSGDMWAGRASAMIAGLLKCLVHMRDAGEIILDISKIREYLPLDKVVELSMRQDIPAGAIDPLRKYLAELPGYTEEEAMMGSIQSKAYEQHGYLIMQFSEIMANLGDTYGHIFSAPLGEVDFKDVVFNRRILFVMLPALEVDPDALAGLGRLVVAGVRAALGPALGNKIEGTRTEVIETKPTNSKVPFMLVLDEYGYYAVKGFAVVAAQARSLGISVIFAGQDYPSFKKGDEIEAQATVANTNIKLIMKLEDAKETYDVVKTRAGEANQMVADRFESKGVAGGYADTLAARNEKVTRLAIEDLVDQDPGEGFIIFRNQVRPIQMFYCDPKEVSAAELNKFVMVRPPSEKFLKSLTSSQARFSEIFGLKATKNEREVKLNNDIGIEALFGDLKALRKHRESFMESTIAAIGMMEVRDKHKDRELVRKSGIDNEERVSDVLDEIAEATAVSDSIDSMVINIDAKREQEKQEALEIDALLNEQGGSEISGIADDFDFNDIDHEIPGNEKSEIPNIDESAINLDFLQAETVDDSLIGDAKTISETVQGLFEDAVVDSNKLNEDDELLNADVMNAMPQVQMEKIAESMGDHSAKDQLQKLMNKVNSKANSYPQNKVSPKRDKEEILDHVAKVLKRVADTDS